MDKEGELLKSVIDNPDDVRPRLAYAQHLEEQGKPLSQLHPRPVPARQSPEDLRRSPYRAFASNSLFCWGDRQTVAEAFSRPRRSGRRIRPGLRRGHFHSRRRVPHKSRPPLRPGPDPTPRTPRRPARPGPGHRQFAPPQPPAYAQSGFCRNRRRRHGHLSQTPQLAGLKELCVGSAKIGPDGMFRLAIRPTYPISKQLIRAATRSARREPGNRQTAHISRVSSAW